MPYIVIAGQELADKLRDERLNLNGKDLCQWQVEVSRRGIIEIEIVQSLYGYSVRYASGLQEWGLLRPARGAKDNSLEAAKKFCVDWVAVAPNFRFATMFVRETA